MSPNMSPKSTTAALIATTLFAGTVGVLVAVTAFGVARISDQALEAIGLIPLRWGETHIGVLAEIAAVASLPVVALFIYWFFKKARRAEYALENYKYTPPA